MPNTVRLDNEFTNEPVLRIPRSAVIFMAGGEGHVFVSQCAVLDALADKLRRVDRETPSRFSRETGEGA